jgi:hypothetical protein
MIIFIITRIFWLAAYLAKNFGIFVGMVEQLVKLFVGLVSLPLSREDGQLAEQVIELSPGDALEDELEVEKILYKTDSGTGSLNVYISF